MFGDLANLRAAAAQEEHQRRGPLPAGQVDATSDYTLSRPLHALDLLAGLRVLGGQIVDAVGLVHNYRVALEHGCGIVRGILGSPGAMGVTGARSTATLPPGTRVLVAWRPGEAECYILSALPGYATSATDSLSDVVVPGSRTGMQVDAYLQGPFLLTGDDSNTVPGRDRTGVVDASADRPSDSLPGGEWGQTTELGGGLHLDPYLAFLRINEETGVFAFYQDDLLRVTGHNLQLGSLGVWREDADDAGILSSEQLVAARDYEALGQMSDVVASPFRTHTATEVQQDTPWYYYLEPVYDDQQGFYRLRRYHGALGLGEKQVVVAPPPGRDGPFRYLVPEKLPGLYDHQVFFTGRQLTRSAKGIYLVKRPPMPVSWRTRPAMTGQGRQELERPRAELRGLAGETIDTTQRLAAFLDRLTYSGNFEGVHPFLDANASWYLPEESNLDFNELAPAPDYYLLNGQQLLPTPDPVELNIGGGYNTAQYFPNQAAFGLDEDGSIVLSDGWGAEIRLSQGSITFQCPGDIWSLPGRNANTWAGADVVLRARKSLDATAAEGDARIKAQNNLMMLGGNDVCGGVLIESRSPSPVYDFTDKAGEDVVTTGIVLKTTNGQIVQMARDIVLGADLLTYTHGLRAGVDGAASAGLIVLDTVGGRVVTYARACERRLGDGTTAGYAVDEVTGPDGSSFVQTDPNGQMIAGELAVAGPTLVQSCLTLGSWLLVHAGHVASASNSSWDSKIAPLSSAAQTTAGEALTRLSERMTEVNDYLADTAGQGQTDYQDCATGDVLTAEFSLRTDEQYRTDSGLTLPEGRWQQAARMSEQTLPVWEEPAVQTEAVGPTLPHPGLQAWSVDASGHRVDLRLYSDQTGLATDRATLEGEPLPLYAEAGVPEAERFVLDAAFTVSVS